MNEDCYIRRLNRNALYIPRAPLNWAVGTVPRLSSCLVRPTPINLVHDPFCPSDRIGYGADRSRNLRLTSIRSKFPRCENAGRNQEHALASLIHEAQSSTFALYSPALRRRFEAPAGSYFSGQLREDRIGTGVIQRHEIICAAAEGNLT